MESITIGGKNYISSKRAAELMGYTQDYIGQLARSKKISAERVSGVWYVDESVILPRDNAEISTDTKVSNGKEKFVDDLSNPAKGDITNKINTKGFLKDKSNITLDGIDYVSSKRAAQIMGYTQDYVGQLCRGGKIEAKQIGRGWYIPKSVVYRDVNKTLKDKVETPVAEDVSKKEALGDILVFKKDAVKDSSPQKEAHKINQIKINSQKDVVKQESREKSKKNNYYYPSFLDATYSIDETPLVPMPKRAREPVLHKIVGEEENTTVNNNVPTRQILADYTYSSDKQDTAKTVNKVQNVTEDVLEPEVQELVKRSPLSLMKMASVVAVVLLIASIVTFIPNTSVFSADTGELKTIFTLKIPQNDTLKAEVAGSMSETTVIETIATVFGGLLDAKMEYKAE